MVDTTELQEKAKWFLKAIYGSNIKGAADVQKYHAFARAVTASIGDIWDKTISAYRTGRQVHYLSLEWLTGRALRNNLLNLGIDGKVKETLSRLDISLSDLEDAESDAGLGNGGLGRLAACFLESSATLSYPVTGYGIRYRYGIFKQSFMEGRQIEEPDNWLKFGDPWAVRREEDVKVVTFNGTSVKAVPYDVPVIGYGGESINTLRLWQCESIEELDLSAFNGQKYQQAFQEKQDAELISSVLYPNDSKEEGKQLRLKQEYFLVSASIQDIVEKYTAKVGDNFEKFSELNAVQLNDTHPAMAVPELLRILTEIYGVPMEKGWEIVRKVFSYTNHTILAEAMEMWQEELLERVVPGLLVIIKKINGFLLKDLKKIPLSRKELEGMRIISGESVHMARLSIFSSRKTNGVARLHTEILKERELKQWYNIYPGRFENVTNGITQRRWLLSCNPELSALITELLGSRKWIVNLEMLKELESYSKDEEVLKRFLDIKKGKKRELAGYIKKHEGITLDPETIFDIQAKRLHEYKRQLLNAFHILDLYFRLKENPEMDIVPRSFIFGAKAAPGYERAKGIIQFINDLSRLINNDSAVKGKLKVVFVQNYRVSYAEKMVPAADISEQISTAGKEASGTGNMKFMLNGALTMGTYDGANIEIVEEAGLENNFIFGLRVEDIAKIERDYDPAIEYNSVKGLKRVVDALVDGSLCETGGGYSDLHDALLKGASWHRADHYYILKDFQAYREAQAAAEQTFRDPILWAGKCWQNICNAGKFSSDRSILEYAEKIWQINPSQKNG